jgi:hypothetical protein
MPSCDRTGSTCLFSRHCWLQFPYLTAEMARRFDVFILSQAGIPSIERWLAKMTLFPPLVQLEQPRGVYDPHDGNRFPRDPEYDSIISKHQVTIIPPDCGGLRNPRDPSRKLFQESYPVEDFAQPFSRRRTIVPGYILYALLDIPFGDPRYRNFIGRHAV